MYKTGAERPGLFNLSAGAVAVAAPAAHIGAAITAVAAGSVIGGTAQNVIHSTLHRWHRQWMHR